MPAAAPGGALHDDPLDGIQSIELQGRIAPIQGSQQQLRTADSELTENVLAAEVGKHERAVAHDTAGVDHDHRAVRKLRFHAVPQYPQRKRLACAAAARFHDVVPQCGHLKKATVTAAINDVNRNQHMWMTGWLCALAAVLAMPPVHSAERVYTPAIHQSVWYAQSSPLACELSHPIPLYGVARFRHDSTQKLQFSLSAHDAVAEPGSVLLSSEHPRWNHLANNTRIAFVSLHPGATPVRLPDPLALRLLLELENGRQPVFRYQERDGAPDTIVVRLSNVNFADAMRQFRYCIGRLGDNDAVAIARVDVHFALDSATLDQRSRPHLESIAAKVVADPGVSRIVLTGYADRSGTRDYNLALSERRARSVLDFLTGLGVDETLLEVVAMGESEPADDHPATSGRRQVTVEILR